MYTIFYNADIHLTEPEQREAMDLCWGFCHNMHVLSSMSCGARSSKRYNMVDKHHFLVHLAMQCGLYPARVWTYGFEDLMGRMERIALASKSGLKASKLSVPLMLKCRNVLWMALRNFE